MSRVVKYHTDNGVHCGIIVEGRKWFKFLSFEYPLHVRKYSMNDMRYVSDVPYKKTRIKQMLRCMSKFTPLSKGAKQMIKELD